MASGRIGLGQRLPLGGGAGRIAAFGGQIAWLLPAALLLLLALLVMCAGATWTDHTWAAALLWGGWLLVTDLAISLGHGIIHPDYTVALAPAIAALVAVLAGPTGYAFATVDVAHSGALPAASPTGGLVPVRTTHTMRTTHSTRTTRSGPIGSASSRSPRIGARPAGPPGRAPRGGRLVPPTGLGRALGGGIESIGGILDANDPTPQLTRVLARDADRDRWVAAAISSNQAAGYQLATGDPVMAIGGFNGTDPAPTLAQFQRWVTAGEVHWFVGRPRGEWVPGGRAAQAIARWVEQRFPSFTVDGRTLYDLSGSPA